MQKYYIYRITNLINGKTYIGQRKCRTKTPETDTYMGSGLYIKRAEKKYGLENFKKDILAKNIETKEMIDELEISYIKYERMKAHYGLISGCYNIADGGNGGSTNKGIHQSAEWIEKRAAKLREKHMSDEVKAKLSASHKGIYPSAETKAKRSAALKGKHRSAETKAKMSAAAKGKHPSAETLAKMNAWKQNMSAESKAKMSAAKKGKHWHLDENGKRVWH